MLPAVLIAVTAFWVVLGTAVFIIALRGGPAGVRATLHTEGQVGRRVRGVVVVAVFVAGLAVPLLVSVSNGEHKAKTGPAGITLTAGEAAGRTLFASKCSTCHTLHAARAVGRVGPNLDVLRPPAALVIDAITHGRARGMGQMPALLFQGSDAKNVADFVGAVAGR
ncbi:MAG: cytochrome [Solirubrobacteraceae bacterium]|jgi:cytochrome c5|nr:cytochrome [Solirubrobacteraceae bacterium]